MNTVIICSDSFKRISGLSYVALNIAKYFIQQNYNVIYCIITGDNCDVNDLKDKGHFFYENLFDSVITNCQNKQKDSSLNFDLIIEKYKPNLIFSIHDLWQFENIAFSKYRDTYTWVAYCPIESHYYSNYIIYPTQYDRTLRKSLNDICENMDYAVAYNSVGANQLKKLKSNVIGVLPNGLDDYYIDEPIDRNILFKGTIKEDDFLFMTVGHNFQRKGLDYVIEAFYEFLSHFDNIEKQKYKLYLHGFLDTVDAGTDIKSMIYHLGLSSNVIMSGANQITKRELYKRYKCVDCYIGLPLAEGYGYGFMEAQINGIPIIYHNVGGIAEYIQKDNISIDSVSNMYPNNYYCIWKIPNIKQTVETMLKIVSDDTFLNIDKIKQKNYEKAKLFTWDKMFNKLDEILQENNIEGKQDIHNKISIRRII